VAFSAAESGVSRAHYLVNSLREVEYRVRKLSYFWRQLRRSDDVHVA